MLDLALVRAEPARVKAALARRGVPAERVDAAVDIDRRWSARREVREALRARRRSPLPYRPIGFADQMADLYAAADLVLARAGGSTLAELTALGLPAILVPYPHATDDHQLANAAALSSAGAAVTVEQWRLSPERLAEEVLSLVSAPERLGRLAARARSLGRPMAAAEVAGELAAMAGFEAGRPGGDAVPRVVSERSLKAA